MKYKIFLIIPLSLFMVACAQHRAQDPSATTYSRDQTLHIQKVQFGSVLSVRSVQIEGTKSGIGAAAGTVVGGVAGSGVGDGRGSTIAAVLGGVAGGVLGDKAENAVTKKAGLELTVQLDNGEIISVVQEAEETFRVGERVRLITSHGVARISH